MDQELVQYLDKQFGGINRRFEQVDQRFEQVDRQFAEMRQEMREGHEEVKRHAGVLVEDLRYQVRLVAESLAVHVEAEAGRHQAIQEQFRETHALIRSSYSHLQQQHNQLNQHVESLERKGQG